MIFVTGANGFVGRHFVAAAISSERAVRCLCRNATLSRHRLPVGAIIDEGDLSDVDRLAGFLAGSVAVVHLAASTRGTASELSFTNIEGTRVLCAAAARAGVRRFIYVSSLQADGKYGTDYGKSKRDAEEVVGRSGLDWTVLRPAQIYGDGDTEGLTRIALAAGRLPILPLPNGGRSLIQPVHVADMVQVMIASLDRSHSIGRRYDIAGPQVLSLAEFTTCAAGMQGRRIRQVAIPMWFISSIAKVSAVLGRGSWLSRDVVRAIALDKVADIGPARRDLGYAPADVMSGLGATLGLGPRAQEPVEPRTVGPAV